MLFRSTNAFELIIATAVSIWVFGLLISIPFKGFEKYWKKTISIVIPFCKKEWKVVLAILITYLLCATKGVVNISFN
jgi:hypothetical protein